MVIEQFNELFFERLPAMANRLPGEVALHRAHRDSQHPGGVPVSQAVFRRHESRRQEDATRFERTGTPTGVL